MKFTCESHGQKLHWIQLYPRTSKKHTHVLEFLRQTNVNRKKLRMQKTRFKVPTTCNVLLHVPILDLILNFMLYPETCCFVGLYSRRQGVRCHAIETLLLVHTLAFFIWRGKDHNGILINILLFVFFSIILNEVQLSTDLVLKQYCRQLFGVDNPQLFPNLIDVQCSHALYQLKTKRLKPSDKYLDWMKLHLFY